MTTRRVFLSLGSNLGDRERNLMRAVESARLVPDFLGLQVSSFYQSPSAGAPGPDYLNAVMAFETALTSTEILEWLHLQEQGAGRIRSVRNAPRTLDIDLLSYGNEKITAPDLKVPHPRLQERAFVLAPLCEIDPNWVHPVLKKTAAELWQALPAAEQANVQAYENHPQR